MLKRIKDWFRWTPTGDPVFHTYKIVRVSSINAIAYLQKQVICEVSCGIFKRYTYTGKKRTLLRRP